VNSELTGRIYETTKWVETTLRKGTNTPKICRDMFLSQSGSYFMLVIVKNGRLFSKTNITIGEASRFQRLHHLKSVSSIFRGAFSYRTQKSNDLISSLLSSPAL
jgi:hypothetical protein